MRPFRSNERLYLTKGVFNDNGPEDVTADPDKGELLLVTKGGTLDLDTADRFNLVGGQYDFGAHPVELVPNGAGEGGGDGKEVVPGAGFSFSQPITESAPEAPAVSEPSAPEAPAVDNVADQVAAEVAGKKK